MPAKATMLWLPSDAKDPIIQFSPSSRVSFLVPAHTKTIRRYCGGRGGHDAEYRKQEMPIPEILYTFDANKPIEQSMRMYVVVNIEGGKLNVRPFRLANVHGTGNVCWGDNGVPNGIRQQINTFWESNFNDDLVPYPVENEDLFVYPHQAFLNKVELRDSAGRYLRENVLYLKYMDTVYNVGMMPKFPSGGSRSLAAISKRLAALGVYNEGGDESYAWETDRRRNLRQNVEKRDKVRHQYNTLYYLYAELSEKINNRVNELRDDWRGVQGMTENVARWVSLSWMYYMTGRKDRCRDTNREAEVEYQELLKKMEQFSKDHKIDPVFLAKCVRLRLKYFILQYRRTHLRDDVATLRREFQIAQMPKKRDKWWGGGWKENGEIQDISRIVLGKENLFTEYAFHGVLKVSYTDVRYADEKLADLLRPLFNKATEGGPIFIPVWRHPEMRDMAITSVGDETILVELRGMYDATMRIFNEEDAKLDQAAKEIFG